MFPEFKTHTFPYPLSLSLRERDAKPFSPGRKVGMREIKWSLKIVIFGKLNNRRYGSFQS
jgi:hypothetical protein